MERILREDFSLGPVSIDLIEPHLYLGGLAAASDLTTLTKHAITHILTIDICPLPRKIRELPHITTKYIQLSDQPKEDLLSHLNETYDFIADAIITGNVLVHCYYGISRSATVVVAFVMKKYELAADKALAKVKTQRRLIHPNAGFIQQLGLYGNMTYVLDKNDVRYKKFRLSLAADRVKRAKLLPRDFHDLIKLDPGGPEQTQPEPNAYRCKKCRRVIACESNIIPHQSRHQDADSTWCRKYFFVEPLAWMNVQHATHGRLLCPKCDGKLGSFSWIMGCQCICGAQIAPAFYLNSSKVDFTNVVKNVEITF